jgi:ElaB/YqjD/DUF883 family membrane-anchored ribosome-binding protein
MLECVINFLIIALTSMKNDNDTTQTPQEILDELRSLVAEAEAMIGSSAIEHSAGAFDALCSRFNDAQARFIDASTKARKNIIAGAKYADDAIRANPYTSVTIAAGIGLLIGLLAGRHSQQSALGRTGR